MSFKRNMTILPKKVEPVKEPFVLTIEEFNSLVYTAKFYFYNYKTGELLDILPPSKTFTYEGEDITSEVCYTAVSMYVDLEDPELWDYLRELKQIQQSSDLHLPKENPIDTSNWEVRTHIGA